MSETEHHTLQEPRFPFRITGSAETQGLRQEIARLKMLVVHLSAIIARNVIANK